MIYITTFLLLPDEETSNTVGTLTENSDNTGIKENQFIVRTSEARTASSGEET